ncbi:MAG: radical SAM protein [Nitrospirae bacterium]|nr:radical SAM protein [Nitrospirota bacterium]
MAVPSYRLLTAAEFRQRVDELYAVLRDCTICPRQCHVDRTAGETGYCRTGSEPFVASWGPHFGEERPLVGNGGSGTIFFGNCNLGCIFCQNYTISHGGEGREITCADLAEVMLSLERAGCHNINLVTPTHQVPGIVHAGMIAAGRGLSVPLVYNCGGYESTETLRLLDGIIDIFMPDLKYADEDAARRYSDAADYPAVAQEAVREMHRQVGDLVMDDGGIALRGLLIRHLVLPEDISGTERVVKFIAEEISRDTYLNIMDQYHPSYRAGDYPEINRRITSLEYEHAVTCARRAGIKRIDGVTI